MAWMKDWDGCVLELTHNHGTEQEEKSPYHNGNSDPRGFGHIGLTVADVYETSADLESAGFEFQKKPDEGKMKGLAFVKSPDDEYWVEILKRTPGTAAPDMGPSFQQTMLRVRDPTTSVKFYEDNFGMTLVSVRHFPEMQFSLYFMATIPEGTQLPEPESDEAWEWVLGFDGATLELTHNHGSEKEATSPYHNGNSDPRGFGHIAFNTDNLEHACAELEAAGVAFQKKPHEGRMKTIAFAKDPDEYWIEIIQRRTSKGFRPTAK
ncbi:glo1 [Symbiodinium sp. KB8]|nr:glo1 [Symbiodinium sp. KB8]